MIEQKREFTGIWIPKVIVEDEDLTWTDRAVYAEISCYDNCFMSNAFLAKRTSISESQVGRIISKLKAKGYVEQTGFDGRKRYLQAVTSLSNAKQPTHGEQVSLRMDAESDSAPMRSIDNNIENTLEAVETKVSPAVSPQSQKKAVWDELVKILGYSTKDITKNVRGQLNNATKQLVDVGATPKEISKRAKIYKDLYCKQSGSKMTAMALVNRWGDCKPQQTEATEEFSGVRYDNKGKDFKFNDAGDVII